MSERAVFVFFLFCPFDVNRLSPGRRCRSFIGCRKSFELNSRIQGQRCRVIEADLSLCDTHSSGILITRV